MQIPGARRSSPARAAPQLWRNSMERMEIRQLYANTPADGTTVTVCGWAKSVRDSKNIGFVNLSDGGCFKGVQVVFEAAKLANYTEVAKAYILYRKNREKMRNMKSTILDYKEIVNNLFTFYLCKLINFGTLNVRGSHIFTDVFDAINKH